MATPAQLEIQSELVEDTVRMSVTGELDIATAPQLMEETQTLLAGTTRRLVIDLSKLTFIDSSGLNLLIALNKRAARDGWQLSLTRPSDKIFAVFSITRADENLPFINDRD